MRKLPREFENPIDNILIDLAGFLSPLFYSLNFTPNTLTTISNVFGITGLLLYYFQVYYFSALMIMIGYAFDCFDGYYARQYKLTSTFGDWYDHISDITVHGILAWMLYQNYYDQLIVIYMSLLLVFMMCIHMALQEMYCGNKHGSFLCFLRYAFYFNQKIDPEYYLGISRFYGCGTVQLYLWTLICLS